MKDNVISFYEKKEEIEIKMLAALPEWQEYLSWHNKKMRRITKKISFSFLKIKMLVILVILIGLVETVRGGNCNTQGLLCSIAFCILKIATNIEGYVLAWVPLEDKSVK